MNLGEAWRQFYKETKVNDWLSKVDVSQFRRFLQSTIWVNRKILAVESQSFTYIHYKIDVMLPQGSYFRDFLFVFIVIPFW